MIKLGPIEVSTIRSGKGDCIHLRYYDNSIQPHNIIIDSGPTSSSGAFRALVNSILSAGEPLDALFITHYDDDHIGGILKVGDPGFQACYFNAYDGKLEDENLSATQSQRLFHMLPEAVVHFTVTAGSVINIGDAKITILGPTEDNLSKARKAMKEADNKYIPLASVTDWHKSFSALAMDDYPAPDQAYSNLASVILVFECRSEKLLFCGDAPAKAIVSGLNEYYGKTKPHFDLVKLPHHGSIRNISDELLSSFNSDTFLVCADGTSHPNKQTIAKILNNKSKSVEPVTFYSNYSWWQNDFLLPEDMEPICNGSLIFKQV